MPGTVQPIVRCPQATSAIKPSAREFVRSRLLRIGTGEGKRDRAGLRRVAGVPQMHLEHGGRHHRGLEIARQERRPGAEPDLDRGVGLELHVGHRVMAPVVDLLGRLDPFELQFGEHGDDRLAVGHALFAPGLLGLLVAEHPGLAAGAQAEDRQVDRPAAGHVRVENRAEAQQPAGLQIDAAGVDPAQRHPATHLVLHAVDHAAGRLGEALGRKCKPRLALDVGREKRGRRCAAGRFGKGQALGQRKDAKNDRQTAHFASLHNRLFSGGEGSGASVIGSSPGVPPLGGWSA